MCALFQIGYASLTHLHILPEASSVLISWTYSTTTHVIPHAIRLSTSNPCSKPRSFHLQRHQALIISPQASSVFISWTPLLQFLWFHLWFEMPTSNPEASPYHTCGSNPWTSCICDSNPLYIHLHVVPRCTTKTIVIQTYWREQRCVPCFYR